ncbi:MAG: CHAT domain-containing protein [Scytolyngbya sp. HA4215-MV1]|jgi:CHAT domain-containing protein|nr:CHAT domain-containing protein [Scytolyngbya sp. HA4215-MV1]
MQFTRVRGLALLLTIATLTISAGQFLRPVSVLAQDCVPGADCEQKLWRSILATYDADLAEARRVKDQAKEVEVIRKAGDAYLYFGEFQKAIQTYQPGLTLARTIKARNEESDIIEKLAKAHNKIAVGGNVEFLEQELQRLRQKGDRESQKIVLAELGTTYLFAENYAKTLQTYAMYLPMVRQDKDSARETLALYYLSRAYHEMGNYPAAVKALQQTIALNAGADPQEQNTYLAQLGEVYLEQGDPHKAVEAFLQALRNASAIKDPFLAAEALQGMATSYAAQKDLKSTLQMLDQAMQMTTVMDEDLGRTTQQQVLDQISLVYGWTGNAAKAIDLQKQIAQVQNDPDAIFYDHLGAFYLHTGQLQEAEIALKRAIEHYAQSRAVLTEGSSNLYNDSNTSYNDDLRSQYEMTNILYHNLQETLVAQKRTDEALEVSEAGRTRAYIDLLTNRLAIDSQAQAKITPPNLEQIKQIAKAQNSTLVEYSVISPDLVGYTDTLEFRWGQDKPKETDLYIWVIKPTGEIAFRSVDLKTQLPQQKLADLITSSFEEIGVRGRPTRPKAEDAKQDEEKTLRQLYDLLIQPIADLLPTDPTQHLTFIPQDTLYLVPFAALKDSTGKYLIEAHTLDTAPSIQILQLTQQIKHASSRLRDSLSQSALVVGNPTMPSLLFEIDQPPDQLASLPGSETEAKAIASLLKTQPYIGKQATETTIVQQLSKVRIAHLATHGILDNLQGLQSAIALAPDDKSDGFLTANEVLHLKLNADLIVLSACNTGQGKITGDGVLGLSRSFLSAGATSLIVSLWAIPDAPTATLMTQFYRNLSQNPDKAQALRQAMLTTRTQYPEPSNWAAFVLIGE